MGGFTNDAMASGSLDKAVAEFEYLKKGIDLVAGRVKRLKEREHEAAAAKEREQRDWRYASSRNEQ
jgi:adenylyl- and sulfurtransferase ThiI